MSSLILFWLGCLAGSVLGVGLTAFIFLRRKWKEAIGTLQIIESEGEDPYLFLSLDTEVASFIHESAVTMNVVRKRASHK